MLWEENSCQIRGARDEHSGGGSPKILLLTTFHHTLKSHPSKSLFKRSPFGRSNYLGGPLWPSDTMPMPESSGGCVFVLTVERTPNNLCLTVPPLPPPWLRDLITIPLQPTATAPLCFSKQKRYRYTAHRQLYEGCVCKEGSLSFPPSSSFREIIGWGRCENTRLEQIERELPE